MKNVLIVYNSIWVVLFSRKIERQNDYVKCFEFRGSEFRVHIR